VISGYLICGMIDADIRNGSFSLGNFYKRRILRILPALFVMLLVTSVLAYAYCLPVELIDFSKSLASAVGSVANVYFAQTAGYFDGPAETKPLLHTWTWSLAEVDVPMQFDAGHLTARGAAELGRRLAVAFRKPVRVGDVSN
jgi:peptidoglycan/LPS O-acetylase OafA/YrhL